MFGPSSFSSIPVFLIYWSLVLLPRDGQFESPAFVSSHYGWMSVLGHRDWSEQFWSVCAFVCYCLLVRKVQLVSCVPGMAGEGGVI